MTFLAAIVFFLGFVAFNVGETATASGTGTALRATLTVESTTPFVVAGRGFVPGERLRVNAARRVKRVTASPTGRFAVRFVGIDVCNGVTIVARGSAGSRATVTFAQLSNIHCL